MSTASVRAAITTYLRTGIPAPHGTAVAGAAIPGLNRVHSAPPYWADGSEWDLAANNGNGAICAVHLAEDEESRITVPVHTGQKIVTYTVGLMIFYQYLQPSNTLSPVDESAWADPLDVIIDGLKALLRADPNCGMPAVVWQSAQQPGDLKIVRDIPRRLPGKVLSWNVLEWHVSEVVTA